MAGKSTFTGVSVCQPHHLTHVAYPDVALLHESHENVALLPVHAAKSRHMPVPLIESDEATFHAHFADTVAGRMSSVTKASIPGKLEAEQLQGSDHAFDISRLVEDMENAEKCSGATCLGVVTHMPGPAIPTVQDLGEVRVRIFRKTTFFLSGGTSFREKRYNFTVADLDVVEHAMNDSLGLWFKNLTDLIFRRSDLAFLCVEAKIKRDRLNMSDADSGWLPPRKPDYLQVLKPMVVNGAILNEQISDCCVCWNPFSEGGEVVQLPCVPVKHRYHLSCLAQVCSAEGADHSRCPLCRVNIITNPTDVELLKYGTIGKDYIADTRYTDFENFQRSCADIDKELAEGPRSVVFVNAALMKAIFGLLVDGLKKESPSSTPLHLQYVRLQELSFLEQALDSTTRVMDGLPMEARTLFNLIKVDFFNAVREAFMTGGLVPTLDEDELAKWANHPYQAARDTLRLGFFTWAMKFLSRVCEFVGRRRCICINMYNGADLGYGDGLHYHGGGVYYNPEAKAWHPPSANGIAVLERGW